MKIEYVLNIIYEEYKIMHRILIIGSDYRWYNEGFKKCFELYNCETRVHKTFIGIKKYDYLMRIKNLFGIDITNYRHRRVEEESKAIWDTFVDFKPNIVFVRTGNQINADTVKKMGNSAITILYITDSLERYPQLLNVAGAYNRVYSFEKSDIEKLSKMSIYAEPLMGTVETSQYFPIQIEKQVDVSFVGAMYPFRRDILRQLVYDLPQVKFEFYGKYTNLKNPIQFIKFKLGKEKYAFKNKEIHYSKVNELYNRSKMCLNLQHPQSKEGWNSRLCEILGAKSFQIVNENSIINDEFAECLVSFKDYNDLKNKIVYYLEHENERNEMAANGYKLVMDKYTTMQSVARILKDICIREKFTGADTEANKYCQTKYQKNR